MILCPTCGASCPDSAPTCATCGSPLVALGTTLTPGTVIRGRYKIRAVLGQGGFGITYQASDTTSGRKGKKEKKVALKELFPNGSTRQGDRVVRPPDLSAQDWQEAMHDFTEESTLLGQLQHPGIMRVYDVFEERGTAYMVMEYLKGETLQDLLDRAGKLTNAKVFNIAEKVLDALEVVHRAGHLHRDLKPGNIFIVSNERVVLIDFGSARSFKLGQTVTHTRLVTPGYAPLEQYGSEARYGPYTDLYALGATLHHALTGKMPPPATDLIMGVPLPPLPPRTSAGLRNAIQSSMALKVQDRPQNAHDLRMVMQGSRLPTPQPAPTPGKPPRKPPFPPPQLPPRRLPQPGPTSSQHPFAVYGGWVLTALTLLIIWGLVKFPPGRNATVEPASSPPASEAQAGPPAEPTSHTGVTPTDKAPQVTYQKDTYVLTSPIREDQVTHLPSGTVVRAVKRHGTRVLVKGTNWSTDTTYSGWKNQRDLLPVVSAEDSARLFQQVNLGYGGIIHLARGAYVLKEASALPIMMMSDQTLRGESQENTWLILPWFLESFSLLGGTQAARLEDLTVHHEGTFPILTASEGQVVLNHVTVLGAGGHERGDGLVMRGSSQVDVLNSTFSLTATAVAMQGQSKLNLRDSRLVNSSGHGLSVGDDASATIRNATLDMSEKCGVKVSGKGSVVAEDSTFNDNLGAGLCSHEGGKVQVNTSEINRNSTGVTARERGQVTISESAIQENGGRGVSLGESSHLDLQNTTLYSNGQSAVVLDHASTGTLQGNSFEQNGGAGLTVLGQARIESLKDSFSANDGPAIQLRDQASGSIKYAKCTANRPNVILDDLQDSLELTYGNDECTIRKELF